MRILFYLIGIIILIVGVSFSVLNSHDVSVNFFLGQKIIYFPLLFLMILFLGAFLGMITLLPVIIKLKMNRKNK